MISKYALTYKVGGGSDADTEKINKEGRKACAPRWLRVKTASHDIEEDIGRSSFASGLADGR